MSCNILIVDDSSLLRKAVRRVAEMAGVPAERLREAANGRDALDVVESEWIDLVLLDINMPVMDGEQFVRELRRRPDVAQTPIIVVSTESNAERLQRLKDMGVTEFLRKPFQPEDLCRLISKLLGVKP